MLCIYECKHRMGHIAVISMGWIVKHSISALPNWCESAAPAEIARMRKKSGNYCLDGARAMIDVLMKENAGTRTVKACGVR